MKVVLSTRKKLPLNRKLEIVNSPVWPVAVDSELICRTDEDYVVRACSIVEAFLPALEGKKFLDPSDDAHIRHEVTIRKGILGDGPYDVILLYDLLDHVDDPFDLLSSCAARLAPGGKIYARCHPWCSRHGGHFYRTHNKAFLHLFLSPEERDSLGIADVKTLRTIEPLDEYSALIRRAGLRIENEEAIKTPVEPIFTQLASRGLFPQQCVKTMHFSFVDYVLTHD